MKTPIPPHLIAERCSDGSRGLQPTVGDWIRLRRGVTDERKCFDICHASLRDADTLAVRHLDEFLAVLTITVWSQRPTSFPQYLRCVRHMNILSTWMHTELHCIWDKLRSVFCFQMPSRPVRQLLQRAVRGANGSLLDQVAQEAVHSVPLPPNQTSVPRGQ